jgi:small subunit ribosomal protein S18
VDKDRDRSAGRKRRGPGSERPGRRKQIKLNTEDIDYKNIGLLRRFITEKGKIRSRRITGVSAQQQADIALAVKRAREMALLPYQTK